MDPTSTQPLVDFAPVARMALLAMTLATLPLSWLWAAYLH